MPTWSAERIIMAPMGKLSCEEGEGNDRCSDQISLDLARLIHEASGPVSARFV